MTFKEAKPLRLGQAIREIAAMSEVQKRITDTGQNLEYLPAAQFRERLNSDLRFTYSVWDCSKPVIAMIDGFCLAGALEFVQMCDVRVASDASRFAVIETRFSNGIATYIMPWILGARCRRLIYTGDMIDAQEAFRLGLVDLLHPRDTLRAETMKLAKRMS